DRRGHETVDLAVEGEPGRGLDRETGEPPRDGGTLARPPLADRVERVRGRLRARPRRPDEQEFGPAGRVFVRARGLERPAAGRLSGDLGPDAARVAECDGEPERPPSSL